MEHMASVKAPSDTLSTVYASKTRKAYAKRMVKIIFAAAPDTGRVWEIIAKALCTAGGQRKRGQPPRGGLERDLQGIIDDMSLLTDSWGASDFHCHQICCVRPGLDKESSGASVAHAAVDVATHGVFA